MELEYVPDVRLDDDYLPLIDSTRSELCVGLYGNDQLLGVLVLERTLVDGFSEEDIKLVRGIAQQVSQAMARSRQSEKLKFQQVVATATAWAADLAHDMNSELGVIRNSAYMIQELVDDSKVLQYAREVEETAERLAGTNPWLPEARPILIDEFVEQKVRAYSPKLAEPVELIFDLNCPNTEVWGNPYFVERVVRHLVRNASRAMEGIEQRRLLIRTNLAEYERIDIQFTDSGPGVPEELRTKILQERVSTKGERQGGFGLLLARQTVEDMGGTIRLLPAVEGEGATFSIRLPIRSEEIKMKSSDASRDTIDNE
jgi:signal transduction histidine kinase